MKKLIITLSILNVISLIGMQRAARPVPVGAPLHGEQYQAKVDQKKQNQLVAAAAAGKIDEVRRLLRFRPLVDINALDENQQAPLHVAITKKNHDMAKFLLQNGANPNLKFSGGLTPGLPPLIEAVSNSDSRMLELLIEFGADPRFEYVTNKAKKNAINHINYSHGNPVEVKKIKEILDSYLQKNRIP
ncbi:hypothetical protein BH09DEP1_BH09DEP1_6130 [soil metagenome]